MNFPEGITWKQRFITGGDLLERPFTLYTIGNLWKNSDNSIIDLSGIDTSSVTNMSNMFNDCSKFTNVLQFDTSNVTSMDSMFSYCSKLTSIPQLDTSNVTDMDGMFNSCSGLTYIPQLDTSNVTSADNMFQYCSSLTSIPLLDVSNLNKVYRLTYSCSKLQHLGGFKNLGMKSSFSGTNDNYFLYACPLLTHESIMNVINNLYDRAAAGYSVLKLKLHANTLALLSDEEKAIATNKGWTLS